MEQKEILKNVRKIEIKTKQLVDGLLQGAYHSIFKGRGVEFSTVREYVKGDDIRSIDWNVTARMNKPFIKEFIEERDLNVYIIFDVSESNTFGSVREKKEVATEIAASLMFAAHKNNDKVGLCLFTNTIEKYIPARKGKKHTLRLIREIIHHQPKQKETNLRNTLSKFANILKKRSIVFIISDFITEDFTKPLKIMKKRHDVICLNLQDIRESEIPDIGYIELEDSETGEQVLVDTSDPEFRKNYIKLVQKRNQDLKKKLEKLKIDLINIQSNEPFEVPLKKFFRLRKRRIR